MDTLGQGKVRVGYPLHVRRCGQLLRRVPGKPLTHSLDVVGRSSFRGANIVESGQQHVVVILAGDEQDRALLHPELAEELAPHGDAHREVKHQPGLPDVRRSGNHKGTACRHPILAQPRLLLAAHHVVLQLRERARPEDDWLGFALLRVPPRRLIGRAHRDADFGLWHRRLVVEVPGEKLCFGYVLRDAFAGEVPSEPRAGVVPLPFAYAAERVGDPVVCLLAWHRCCRLLQRPLR